MSDVADPGYSRLGQLIRLWMDAQPVTPSERWIGDHIGRSKVTVNRWMHGKGSPGPEDLRKLAELMAVPQVQLFRAILEDAGFDPDEVLGGLYPENPAPMRKSGRSA